MSSAPGTAPAELRPLTVEDVPQVFALERAVFPAEAWTEWMLREELTHPAGTYLGFWDGPQLVAYGGIKGTLEGDLMTLGVLAPWRGQHLGRRLLLELISRVQARGMKRVFLEVRASNVAAISLYHSVGFTDQGSIRNYYRSPREDALTMLLEMDAL